LFMGFKLYSVAKYLVRTSENMICSMRMMSKAVYDKLAPDLQRIVLAEAKATDEVNNKFAADEIEKLYKGWQAGGGEYITMSPAERKKFTDLLRPVGDEVVKSDPELKAAYEAYKRVADTERRK